MIKIEKYLFRLFIFIVSVFFGFIDVICYYPGGRPDNIPFYGDGISISFSLFNFIVVYLLFEILFYLYYGGYND